MARICTHALHGVRLNATVKLSFSFHRNKERDDSTVARCRIADIALLRLLGTRLALYYIYFFGVGPPSFLTRPPLPPSGVKCISDLMIEQRKLKYGVYVSSSEKADQRGEGCGHIRNISHENPAQTLWT